MGASAAFHLAEAGVSVVLVERGELSGGSTSKAAGGVRANFSDELNIMLGKRSLDLFADFPQRPGQEIDLHRSGYLFVLTRPEDVELFTASVALQNSLGVESRMVDVDEACRLSPLLDPEGVLAAAWSPHDGHCTPESVVLGTSRSSAGPASSSGRSTAPDSPPRKPQRTGRAPSAAAIRATHTPWPPACRWISSARSARASRSIESSGCGPRMVTAAGSLTP